MTVAIIDYGSGNLHSAQKAFEFAGREAGGGAILVTSDPEKVRTADRLVLPGVGAFADCRRGLDACEGLIEAMEEAVFKRGRPFLGICVGMQLMADRGLEHETAAGLGWIGGDVVALAPSDRRLRIPHMGWNTINRLRDHALLEGLPLGDDGLHAYFVHSYYFAANSVDSVIAETEYGGPVTAIVGRDNIAGCQFHPEKSQKLGLSLIANFLRWQP